MQKRHLTNHTWSPLNIPENVIPCPRTSIPHTPILSYLYERDDRRDVFFPLDRLLLDSWRKGLEVS